MKHIAILGSTGAVGQQALEVVRTFPARFKVVGLAAHTNHRLLAQQVEEFQPELVSYSEEIAPSPSGALAEKTLVTMEEMAAKPEVDLVVSATVSALVGLPGTLAAIKAGKTVALANKEVMVMAGSLLMEAAKEHGAAIFPVDGALSAIWQCLRGEPGGAKRVSLTVSEGPLAASGPAEATHLRREAVAHPSWRLGRKGRVDSMTLMNVGMQAIEARWLFDIPYDRIEVVAHPEAVVRAMVEFEDGSVKAVFSQPTLHLPLQYALSYPERWYNEGVPSIDLLKVGRLTFHPVDLDHYPCLAQAFEAGRQGGTATAVLNAADEVAVWAFLTQQIGLNEVPKMITSVLRAHQPTPDPTLKEIFSADAWGRKEAPKHTVW